MPSDRAWRRKEGYRDARGIALLDDLRQDVRYAIRSLAKARTFTAAAVGTLALGIGASVGVFTVVNAVLLQPLPVRDAARLGVVVAQDRADGGEVGASWTKFARLRERRSAFASLAAYIARDFTIDTHGAPMRVLGTRVTAEFFDVLGVPPALGRSFRREEDVEGAAPVAIVTDALWRRSLGGEPAIVGGAIRVDGRDTTVVGVLPPGFRFEFADREPQIFLTSVFTPGAITAAQIRYGAGFLSYVGRLAPGATFDQAQRDLAAFDDQYQRDFGSYTDARKYRLRVRPLLDTLVGDVRRPLLLLLGAVLLLLVIACANVAHLMLARAASRRREIAVRLALGASAGRIGRHFLTESLVLAAAGGALGVLAARAAVAALAADGPPNIPRLADAAPDGRVVAFAVIIAAASAVAFGLAPARRLRTTSVTDALGDRSGGLTHGAGRLHRAIAVSESAITLVLLVAAGLLFESVVRLQSADIGFNPQQVYAAQLSLPRDKYSTPELREHFFTELLRTVQAQPGIDAAGATSYLPMGGSNYGFFFYVEGQPRLGPGRDNVTAARHVSTDYFRVMRIPVRAGRAFADRDTPTAPPVAVVNETFARRFFPGVDPIGRHVANSGDGIMREIVGVVSDVKFDGPAREGQQELYLPFRQVPWPSMAVVVSSALPSSAVAGALRQSVARLDRDQAFAEVRPMPSVVAATTTQQRFTTSLIAMFALLATTLAAIGLYGVVALFVGQRRHEFGIRMALGAQRADVLRLVMREGWLLVGSGLVFGVGGAAAVSRVLQGVLFGVSPLRPLTYVAGAIVLLAVGGVACYLPARRAVAVPPLDALRTE